MSDVPLAMSWIKLKDKLLLEEEKNVYQNLNWKYCCFLALIKQIKESK